MVESPPADAGDTGSCPGPGRSHMPWSGWAREQWPLSLRVPSLCSAAGEATAVRGPLRSTGSGCAGSAAMAHGPSRSAACGILPDRGTNPCPLHRQADSQPLRHQGSPPSSLIAHHPKFSLREFWILMPSHVDLPQRESFQ